MKTVVKSKLRLYVYVMIFISIKASGQCFAPLSEGYAPEHMLVDVITYNNKFVVLDLYGYVILGSDQDHWKLIGIGHSLFNSVSWDGRNINVPYERKILQSQDLIQWSDHILFREENAKRPWIYKSYFFNDKILLLESSVDPFGFDMLEWGIPYNERSFRSSYKESDNMNNYIYYGNDLSELAISNPVPKARDIIKINNNYLLLTRDRGIYISKDMKSWAYYSGEKQLRGYPRSMAYNGSVLVTVGDFGYIATSLDKAKTWKVQRLDTEADFYHVIWDRKQFIAVGNCGTVAKSVDGHTWSFTSTGQPDFYKAIAYNGDAYVIVGAGPGKERNKKTNALLMQRLFISKDAKTWVDYSDKIIDLYR